MIICLDLSEQNVALKQGVKLAFIICLRPPLKALRVMLASLRLAGKKQAMELQIVCFVCHSVKSRRCEQPRLVKAYMHTSTNCLATALSLWITRATCVNTAQDSNSRAFIRFLLVSGASS